ncbi:hypothetical protein [Delftia sp. CH05]|uniref:hypothetical protein n=1 Tax=Delftia sp. CH05 TaxID=2692194 RepID=UPI00135EE0F0|nr:hypothetical protein [Delftia sp. CH05]MXN30015.1 hypothetical protein [Delftia sp. CH05]
MEHLKAIDIGLSSGRNHNEIARKIFLTYPTKAFVGEEELQFEILNEVSEHFEIAITCIHVAGSAKLGHSIHKNRSFTRGTSDLDLAIIDSHLFAKYVEIGLNTSKGYSDGTKFPVRQDKSRKDEYLQYLSRGIFRPDLMPTGTHKAAWLNFFGRLSDKHSSFFGSISGAIYLSQGCFESKQRTAIKARLSMEVL